METISTSDPEKLPEAVRGLLLENQPLPPGVSFFEQRYTAAAFVKRIGIGLVLFLIAVVLILYSLEFLYEYNRHVDPKYREYFNLKAFVAGAAFAYAGWLMVGSVREGRRLQRRQAAGGRTRHGIFLTPGALVCQSQFDTTVIPRGNFRGLNGGNVDYTRADQRKSFGLPTDWIGASPVEVQQAIVHWSQTVPPASAVLTPPPPPFA